MPQTWLKVQVDCRRRFSRQGMDTVTSEVSIAPQWTAPEGIRRRWTQEIIAPPASSEYG
jgi:hypothetical protein